MRLHSLNGIAALEGSFHSWSFKSGTACSLLFALIYLKGLMKEPFSGKDLCDP